LGYLDIEKHPRIEAGAVGGAIKGNFDERRPMAKILLLYHLASLSLSLSFTLLLLFFSFLLQTTFMHMVSSKCFHTPLTPEVSTDYITINEKDG